MVTGRLLDLLVRDAVTRYCVLCLAGAADISPHDAESAVRAVAQDENVQILFGECDLCGRRDSVIRRRRAPTLFGA
jgi:hypothetical protein